MTNNRLNSRFSYVFAFFFAASLLTACKNSGSDANATAKTTANDEMPMNAPSPMKKAENANNNNESSNKAISQEEEEDGYDGNDGEEFEQNGINLYASASSALKPSNVGNYNASNAIDGDPNTPWVEGAQGLGVGEWLKLEFSQASTVSSIRIINGYNYTSSDNVGDRFYKNGRVKTATLEFSDGSRKKIQLKDNNKWQTFNLGGIETSSIRLVIDAAYKGTKWDDVCISEIEVFP